MMSSHDQDTFEANLSQSQKEEMANQKAYEDLKAAKEAEIGAGQEQIDTKTDELAATDEKLASPGEDVVVQPAVSVGRQHRVGTANHRSGGARGIRIFKYIK